MLLFGNPTPELLIAVVIALTIGMTIHEFAHNYVGYLAGDMYPERDGRLTLNPLVHIHWIGWLMFVLIGFGILGSAPISPYRMRNPRWGYLAAVAAGPFSNLLVAVIFGVAWRVLGFAQAPRIIWLIVLIAISASMAYSYFYRGLPWRKPQRMRYRVNLSEPFSRHNLPLTGAIITAALAVVVLLFGGSGFVAQTLFLATSMTVSMNVLLFIFNLIPLFPLDGWHIVLAALPPEPATWWQRNQQNSQFLFMLLIIMSFLPLSIDPLGLIIGRPTFWITNLILGV